MMIIKRKFLRYRVSSDRSNKVSIDWEVSTGLCKSKLLLAYAIVIELNMFKCQRKRRQKREIFEDTETERIYRKKNR